MARRRRHGAGVVGDDRKEYIERAAVSDVIEVVEDAEVIKAARLLDILDDLDHLFIN